MPAAGIEPAEVAPLVGAWIEIAAAYTSQDSEPVAPLVGAWIEISFWAPFFTINRSLPSWERGLKSELAGFQHIVDTVAPLAGAWIEILNQHTGLLITAVAPLAGAWIEIGQGLHDILVSGVAPLAGAWIEIFASASLSPNICRSLPSRERGLKFPVVLIVMAALGRSPRGSVD